MFAVLILKVNKYCSHHCLKSKLLMRVFEITAIEERRTTSRKYFGMPQKKTEEHLQL